MKKEKKKNKKLQQSLKQFISQSLKPIVFTLEQILLYKAFKFQSLECESSLKSVLDTL